MKSWYKTAQSKPRQYSFDNKENVFYKIIEKEEPFEEDTEIRVYHGFRDMNDAIITAKYGISGQERAGRVYSYEANNNPMGLFITSNFNSAKEFTTHGSIMEFVCKFSELEIPVWPGGGYTVQGEMSQRWDSEDIEGQRQEAILKQREEARQSEYEAIAKSSRPEVAQMLTSPGEYQALFIGNLNPSRISKFWIQEKQEDYARVDDPWKEMSKDEFIETIQYSMSKDLSGRERMTDQHRDIENKAFAPEDAFNHETLLQKISEHGYDAVKILELIKRWGEDQAQSILKDYVWPNQSQGLNEWIKSLFQ